jgi:hypothetical protein
MDSQLPWILVELDLGDPDASTSPKMQKVNKTSLKLSSLQDTCLSLSEVVATRDFSRTRRAFARANFLIGANLLPAAILK